jgi:ankyrin repeat protein
VLVAISVAIILLWLTVAGSRKGNGRRQLVLAVNRHDVQAVRRMLAQGADPNARDYSDHNSFGDWFGRCLEGGLSYSPTVLLDAAASGDLPIIRDLVDSGADINEMNGYYGTALSAAVQSKKDDAVKLLVASGADVDKVQEGSETPLQEAVENCRPDTVRFLISHRANVRAKTNHGLTPLMLSTKDVTGRNTAVMLEYDGGVNAKDANGYTALMTAAASLNVRAAQELLDKGADPNMTGSGNTPLHLVKIINAGDKKAQSSKQYNQLISLLRAHGGHE